MTDQQRYPPRGFSLVEVTLALAVASLAILSLLGLIPMLLDGERENSVKSLFPAMGSQVMGKLRAEPYPTTLPTTPRLLYFTDQGTPTSNPQEAVYECKIIHKTLTAEAPRPGGARPPEPGNHCHIVHMQFRWPSTSTGGSIRHLQATLSDD